MVLDIGLPEMDGFEVLRRLRADRNALPVVILTARDNVRDSSSSWFFVDDSTVSTGGEASRRVR
jgi:CheY-like chemotaxis protein